MRAKSPGPGHAWNVQWSIYSNRLSSGQHQYSADADWVDKMAVHIGATWQIWLNRVCGAVMWPYLELLWPLVIIRSSRKC